MLKRKFYSLIAIIMALSMAFSGCGDEEKPVPAVSSKGAITMQMRIPTTINPLMVENQSVKDALSLCYEPLLALNDKMEPEGVLATDVKVADDAMSAIVTLEPNAVWHDGVEFSSADVVYTINCLKGTPDSVYYECVENIESATAIDSKSLTLVFQRPYGQIEYSLYFPIIAAHVKEPDEKIVGTGPYKVEKYSEGISLELKKHDKWHGGNIICDKVNISLVRDSEVATSAFNSGSINAITGSFYDSENSALKNNARVTQYPSTQYEFIAFNHDFKMFSSAAVRTAVSRAINREQIVKEAYTDTACAANSPTHVVAEKTTVDSGGTQYSLSEAEEILFLEGYVKNESTGMLENEDGESLSFTLLVNHENQARVKAAELLSSQLFLAGIEVKVRELNFQKYAEEITAGNYDAYLGGTTLANMYDFEFLLSEEAPMNTFGYVSEYMTAALSGIAAANNADKLGTALVNFEEVFLDEQPICGIVFKNDTLITAENVMGEIRPYPAFPYRSIHKWNVG